ncbi:MAG: hypothetical protein GC160_05490 [Acidobacteria bacterium]|nr:hypothetical protein [Acidobacteriota bacterium]
MSRIMGLSVAFIANLAICHAGVVNGDFSIPQNTEPIQFHAQAAVKGWNTTDSKGQIEIWKDGAAVGGVTFKAPATFKQFAEVNANSHGTLSQEVLGIGAGNKYGFSFYHRGRHSATEADVIEVTVLDGSAKWTKTFKTTNADWKLYQEYVGIKNGNGPVQLSFKAVSTASKDPSIGNFLTGVRLDESVVPTVTTLGGGSCFMLKAPTVDGAPANGAQYLSYSKKAVDASGRTDARVGAASADSVPLQLTVVPVDNGRIMLKALNYPTPAGVNTTGKAPVVLSFDNGQLGIMFREPNDRAYMMQIAPLGKGGSGNNVSFESKWGNTNGWHMRNQKSYAKLHPTTNPSYNKEDATWLAEPCGSVAVAPTLPQQMYLFTYSIVGNVRPEGKMDKTKEYFLRPAGGGVKIVQGQPEKLIVEKLPNGTFKLKTAQNLYLGFVKKASGSLQYTGTFGDAAAAEVFTAEPATISVCTQGQQPTKDKPCLTPSEAQGFVSLKPVASDKQGYLVRHENYIVGLVAPGQFNQVKANLSAYNTLLGDTSWRFEKADQ